MGCGCKKKKQAPLTDSQKANVVAERRGDLIKEQKEYQDKVKSALRHLMDIKRRKQGRGKK
jgi:hypothetical protein|tara:strand:- start:118 stop:300 length:183 start_codon:yes stop_codon:yes gene_type:complete